MKRFFFRLQNLLEFYSLREEMERIKLDDLLRQVREVESSITKHFEAVQRTGQELRNRERLSPEELTTSDRYISHLREQVRRLGAQAIELERQTMQQREVVVSASRRRKVFEALRDREQKDYDRRVERLEQQLLDELHLQRRSGRRDGQEKFLEQGAAGWV